jgi:hypothetical protein
MQKKNMRKNFTYLRRLCRLIFIYMNVEIVETWNRVVNKAYRKPQPFRYISDAFDYRK